MKLCIVSLKKFCFHDGRYWTYGGFGEYVTSFLPYFDEIHLCVPVTRVPLAGMYPLSQPQITITELPFYKNELHLLLKLPAIFLRMRAAIKRSDVINPRIPDMTGVAGWIWACWYRKPLFVSMQSDMQAFLDAPNNTRTSGLVRRGLYAWIRLYLMLERRIASTALCFPQGRKLAQRLSAPHAHEWISSSINASDVVATARSYEAGVIRLLHVGRITRAKGHIHLIRALQALRSADARYSFTLQCVGKSDEILMDELIQCAREAGVDSDIRWADNVERGARLWEFFDSAHVFVFPSIWEGTPKVLLEAMARGLPIVASNVGGVGTLVTHETTGLLVPSQDPQELAAAILRMVADAPLREGCVAAAYGVARDHTVEVQTRFIVEKLIEHYPALGGRVPVAPAQLATPHAEPRN